MAWALLALLFVSLPALSTCQAYDKHGIQVDESKHDEQFFNYFSRPDIDAPRWGFKVYNESALAPGYWFVSPYDKVEQTGTRRAYVGPAIYDSTNGELVWNGASQFQRYNTYDLKISNFKDKGFISLLHPQESHGVLMNKHYVIKRHIRTGTRGKHDNMHDFQIVDNGKKALYLTTTVKQTSRENSLEVAFKGRCNVAFTGFEERKVGNEKITFEWFPENFIALNESYMYRDDNVPPKLCQNGNFDYLHLNSVEKLPDGDYLISGRRTYAIYKISQKDGSILWRLGGKKSDFQFDEGTHFTGQHDVRCLSQNSTHMILSMMDNAVGPHGTDKSNPNSRGLVLSVNTEAMTASEVSKFDHPYGVGAYAPGRGNFQTLPNGNAFVSWTNDGLHSEHSPDGEVVAEAMWPCGLKTYRSYKFPWIGLPQSPPDVHSQVVATGVNDSVNTVVHVSWNGDTEAATWHLYKTDKDGRGSGLIGSSKRTGFETKMTYRGYAAFVKVDATDRDGNKRTESWSGVAETIALPDREGRISLLLGEYLWQDILSNAVFTFLSGVLFCFAAMLIAWAVWRWALWRACGCCTLPRRRKRQLYTALNDKDEAIEWSEGGGLLHEENKDMEPLDKDGDG